MINLDKFEALMNEFTVFAPHLQVVVSPQYNVNVYNRGKQYTLGCNDNGIVTDRDLGTPLYTCSVDHLAILTEYLTEEKRVIYEDNNPEIISKIPARYFICPERNVRVMCSEFERLGDLSNLGHKEFKNISSSWWPTAVVGTFTYTKAPKRTHDAKKVYLAVMGASVPMPDMAHKTAYKLIDGVYKNPHNTDPSISVCTPKLLAFEIK